MFHHLALIICKKKSNGETVFMYLFVYNLKQISFVKLSVPVEQEENWSFVRSY